MSATPSPWRRRLEAAAIAAAHRCDAYQHAATAEPVPTYGARDRFGPLHYQAMRFVGRWVERAGTALDSRSWGGHE